MGMVWDYAMLCYKAIYTFNQYAINQFCLYIRSVNTLQLVIKDDALIHKVELSKTLL